MVWVEIAKPNGGVRRLAVPSLVDRIVERALLAELDPVIDLALDLMEEFGPVVVDAVVLRCLSTGIVKSGEFETIPDRGCPMNARARQAFLAAYERRMLTVFTHEQTGRRVSYCVAVGLQARAIARAILDPERIYRPVRWK